MLTVYICYFSFNSAIESRRVGFSHGPSSSQISQDHRSNQTVCLISFWKFPAVTCSKYMTLLREVKSNFSLFGSFYPYININRRVFRLFTVLNFSVRSSRSRALRYGLPILHPRRPPPPYIWKSLGTLRSDDGEGRLGKRRWKSEFAFFQSSSRLLQVTYFLKCRRTLLKLNS